MNHVTKSVDEVCLVTVFLRANRHAGRLVVDRLDGIRWFLGFEGGKIHDGFHRKAKEHVY